MDARCEVRSLKTRKHRCQVSVCPGILYRSRTLTSGSCVVPDFFLYTVRSRDKRTFRALLGDLAGLLFCLKRALFFLFYEHDEVRFALWMVTRELRGGMFLLPVLDSPCRDAGCANTSPQYLASSSLQVFRTRFSQTPSLGLFLFS